MRMVRPIFTQHIKYSRHSFARYYLKYVKYQEMVLPTIFSYRRNMPHAPVGKRYPLRRLRYVHNHN